MLAKVGALAGWTGYKAGQCATALPLGHSVKLERLVDRIEKSIDMGNSSQDLQIPKAPLQVSFVSKAGHQRPYSGRSRLAGMSRGVSAHGIQRLRHQRSKQSTAL